MQTKGYTPLKAYVVTHPSSDRTFLAGDLIWWSENGQLNCCQGMGWLEKEEWNNAETNDFRFKESEDYHVVKTNYGESIRKIERNM